VPVKSRDSGMPIGLRDRALCGVAIMDDERLATQLSHADKIKAGCLKWRGAPPGLSVELANLFMAQLKAGRTLSALTSGVKRHGPAMVTADRFKKHCLLNPDWAVEARTLAAVNAKAADKLKSSVAKTSRTHCSRGHDFALSGMSFKRHVNGKQYRYCKMCNTENSRRGGEISVEVVEKIKALARAGKSVHSFTSGGKPGYIARFYSVKLLRTQDAELDHLLRTNQARCINTVQVGNIREPALTGRIAAQPHEVFSAVDGAVSRRLPRHIRDDVMGRLMLDILELRVDISAVAHFARLYTKQAYNEIDYPIARSLDSRLSADSRMTLLDRVSAEAGSDWWEIGMAVSNGRQIR
jgi:hypothetical protein